MTPFILPFGLHPYQDMEQNYEQTLVTDGSTLQEEETDKRKKELATLRKVGAIVGIAYPLFGYLNTFIVHPQYEDLGFFKQRLILGFFVLLFTGLTYQVKKIRDNFHAIVVWFSFIILSHLMYIGAMNGFTFHHSLGVFMVIVANAFVINRHKDLNIYLVYVIPASILSVLLAPKSEVPAVNLIIIFPMISLFLYFVLGMKFKLQRVLEESHANISALLENTNDIIWSIDADYNYLAFNKPFEDMAFLLTGQKPVLGEKNLDIVTEKELSEKLLHTYERTLQGLPEYDETSFLVKGEQLFSVSSNPIRLPDGTVIGVTMFAHNITRAKRTELLLKQQKQQLELHQREIMDSINYAERIQRTLLASDELLHENLNEHFVYFKPKDVVSGDFYWAHKLENNHFVLATADSTGHGVPGAIMSILNISCIEKAIEVEKYSEPADILNHTRRKIIETLKKDGSADGGKDGMDCSLVSFDLGNNKLSYAAANNPVWVVRNSEIIELAANKMSVGKHDHDNIPFVQHCIDLEKGDVVYTLTDGLPDQFGGPKGKKFMHKQLKALLLSIAHLPMNRQQEMIHNAFDTWKGTNDQVDDVLVIGVRI